MSTPQIVTRAGWGARAPRGSVATTTWARRTGVAIHHSAGPTTQTVRSIQDHQMDRNGWQDIGYNWLVTQDGRIWEGRAGGWLAIGAHAANQNTAWIGICWIGTSGSTAPSAAALASIRWLVDEARRLAGRRLEVRGHGQVPGQATECPGSRLRAWISDGMPAATPPAGREDDMGPRDVWWLRLDPEATVTRAYPGVRPDGYLARTWLQYSYRWARTAADRAGELLAGQAAILARLDGADDGATRQAIREELAAHRAELLAELGDGLAEQIAAELRDVPAGQVEAAVGRALGRLRLVAEPGS